MSNPPPIFDSPGVTSYFSQGYDLISGHLDRNLITLTIHEFEDLPDDEPDNRDRILPFPGSWQLHPVFFNPSGRNTINTESLQD